MTLFPLIGVIAMIVALFYLTASLFIKAAADTFFWFISQSKPSKTAEGAGLAAVAAWGIFLRAEGFLEGFLECFLGGIVLEYVWKAL